ncbi:MAG TPA: AAA family ATPase [Candidatus Baltobacteraceae bacterium]
MSDLRFDVVGAHGPRTFFERMTRENIAHAYLFSGQPGVGKKTFARRLAQSLLCDAPKTAALGYDATCASCRLFSAGDATRHPDFLENLGTLKIGDSNGAQGFYEGEGLTARDIVRQFSLESYSGGMRVLMLGDVEFATHHAASALLKFFEEPPDNVVLILTTSAPGMLLPTIRSRMVEVRFAPLSIAETRDVLARMGYDERDAALGAKLGQGSVTRATAALGGGEESLRAQVAEWFFAAVGGATPPENWATRETLDEGIETIKALACDWVALGATSDAPLVAVDFDQRLRDLPALDPAVAVAMLSKIDDAQRIARTNVSPNMVGELVRMAITR